MSTPSQPLRYLFQLSSISMQTYFARHGSKLDIDEDTYQRLWEDDIIAIHYPWTKNDSHESDSESIDPQDYEGTAKSAIKALHEMAENGGYVCAVYDPFPGCKVGFVEPGSSVELFRGTWGDKNDRRGQEAVLKSVKLSEAKNLGETESIKLLSGRPRQGTFCRWHKASGRVEALVEENEWFTSIDRLGTARQEVLCSEILRLESIERFGVPQVQAFVLPVGRTLKDIDILGIDEEGDHVIAQVTNHELQSGSAKEKLHRLKKYDAADEAHRILFCHSDKVSSVEEVTVFPLDKAFDLWKTSDLGQKWLEA